MIPSVTGSLRTSEVRRACMYPEGSGTSFESASKTACQLDQTVWGPERYIWPLNPPFPGGLSSVQFSCSVVSDSLQPHGLQHTRLPCPSPTPKVHSNSCPLSWWRHPTSLSSVVPFSSLTQSFPASGSFPMSQFFTSGGQSTGVSISAPVLPMNIQD